MPLPPRLQRMHLYVDDVLIVHHDATDVLLRLHKYFKTRPGSIGDPDVYLGATIKQMHLANGVMAWASSPLKYVQALVDAVTKYLTNLGDKRWSMPKKAANPFPGDYEPELDTTPILNPGCRRGMPLSSECSDGWLRLVEWISSRRYRRWPPKWHRLGKVILMRSCTFLVSCESTTTCGWRTTHRTPPLT